MSAIPAPEELRHFTAPPDQKPERLDKVLAERFADLSRSRLKNLIEGGMASLDSRPALSPSASVKAGMSVSLRLPPPVSPVPAPENIGLDVLYEDDSLLVINKPAGLVVHPAPGNETGTLVNGILGHCGESLAGIGGEKRPGIVHRLDRDTSGVMVIAKTETAHRKLSQDFAARNIERVYLALAWGALPASGRWEGNIGRDRTDRKRMAVVATGGKAALTHYRTQEIFHNSLSLAECRLATGRTHQIRVHFAHNRHPLVGDPLYLRRIPAISKTLPAQIRSAMLDFPRQALHAATLGFTHPLDGRKMHFSTPLPEDFEQLLKTAREI